VQKLTLHPVAPAAIESLIALPRSKDAWCAKVEMHVPRVMLQ